MKFSFINLLGLIIIVGLLIPNIVYALKIKDKANSYKNRYIDFVEQISRYASMLLIVLPIGVGEFGFASIASMFLYMIGNFVLLFIYLIVFILFLKKQTTNRAICLAIIPSLIFLLSGITLNHYLLVISAVIFGTSHIFITYQNFKGVKK